MQEFQKKHSSLTNALILGLPEARKLYQKLNWSPPLSDKLHACMVELELSKETVDVKKVRGIFTTAVQQFGKKHPGKVAEVIFKLLLLMIFLYT